MQGQTATVKFTSKFRIYHNGDVATFPVAVAETIVGNKRGIYWDHENGCPTSAPEEDEVMEVKAAEKETPEPKSPKKNRRKKLDKKDLNAKEGNYETR